jgi:hypothetical protein
MLYTSLLRLLGLNSLLDRDLALLNELVPVLAWDDTIVAVVTPVDA